MWIFCKKLSKHYDLLLKMALCMYYVICGKAAWMYGKAGPDLQEDLSHDALPPIGWPLHGIWPISFVDVTLRREACVWHLLQEASLWTADQIKMN